MWCMGIDKNALESTCADPKDQQSRPGDNDGVIIVREVNWFIAYPAMRMDFRKSNKHVKVSLLSGCTADQDIPRIFEVARNLDPGFLQSKDTNTVVCESLQMSAKSTLAVQARQHQSQ